MSVQSFNRWFTNPIVKKLTAEQSQRKKVEQQKGQVLLLEDANAFSAALNLVYGKSLSEEAAGIALAAGRAKALELQKDFFRREKRKFNQLVQKSHQVAELNNHILGEDMFLVQSFSHSIPAVKRAMLKALVTSGNLSEEESDAISPNVHRGHGSRGLAVSQVDIARAMGTVENKVGSEDSQVILGLLGDLVSGGTLTYEDYAVLDTLSSKYTQVVTKTGALRANYVSVVTFQLGTENREEGQDEKRIKGIFRDFIKNIDPQKIANYTGSSSLKDKVGKTILNAVTPKNAKVTSPLLGAGLTSSGSTSHKFKEKQKKPTFARYRDPKSGKFLTKDEGVRSYINIKDLLNSYIEEYVSANMYAPALRYQTGRFASSVRILNITPTASLPLITYTYMLYPYQTFEPGFKQGDIDRDPRLLISESIRQLAVSQALGKFSFRRV